MRRCSRACSYCVVGTVGNRLLQGTERVQIDARTTLTVRCGIKPLSFSAHADAKGIMSLIRRLEPRHVLLVHGERRKMAYLKRAIMRDIGIPTFDPPNGTSVTVPVELRVPVAVPERMLAARRKELADSAVAAADAASRGEAADADAADADADDRMATDDAADDASKRRRHDSAVPDATYAVSGALLTTTAADGSVRVRATPWPRAADADTDAADGESAAAMHALWLQAGVDVADGTALDALRQCVAGALGADTLAPAAADGVVRTARGSTVQLDGTRAAVRWSSAHNAEGERIVAALQALR